jgi:hypothetical protein
MAKKASGGNPNPEAVKSEACPVGGCKKPMARLNFCNEHFEWFKEGLVNKRGERPSDFDKKHQAYMRKKAA